AVDPLRAVTHAVGYSEPLRKFDCDLGTRSELLFKFLFPATVEVFGDHQLVQQEAQNLQRDPGCVKKTVCHLGSSPASEHLTVLGFQKLPSRVSISIRGSFEKAVGIVYRPSAIANLNRRRRRVLRSTSGRSCRSFRLRL